MASSAFEGVVEGRSTRPCAKQPAPTANAKALNRQEFDIIGWSDPEIAPHVGALLLGYYTDDGKLA